jgi:hypothetical protein
MRHVVILGGALMVGTLTAGALTVGQRGDGAAKAVSAPGDPSVVAQPAELPSDVGDDSGSLSEDTIEKLNLDSATVELLGDYGSLSTPYRLFFAKTIDGLECLVEDGVDGTTPDGRPLRVYGRACSPKLFEHSPFAIVVSRTGGPDVGTVRSVRVVGRARPDVDRMAIRDDLGELHAVALNAQRAFFFELPQAVLDQRAGVGAVIAYDESGAEVGRRGLG